MRRLTITTRLLGAVAVLLATLGVAALAAAGAESRLPTHGPAQRTSAIAGAESATRCDAPSSAGNGTISIITVSGLLDPVTARFIERSLEQAIAGKASWLVISTSSSGSVITSERLASLLAKVKSSPVPVAVWVGQAGATARGGMAQVAAVACVVGLAPVSSLGKMGELEIDPAELHPAFRTALDRLADGTVNTEEAMKLDLSVAHSEVLRNFVANLPGIETRETKDAEGRSVRVVSGNSVPVISKPTLSEQLLHTVSSPPVAYLMLLIGLSLIVFELFTAGVGVAGLIGAGATVLGCYGLAALPARWWAVGLLVATVVAYAVDVQTGVPRFWTAAGTLFLVIGSLFLFEGLALSWITLLGSLVGMLLFVMGMMPAMVRTRFSTPTIGRGWMVGEEGEAETDVDPDGVVTVRGANWKARTNRATPVTAGSRIRVIEVDGLLLEIEPLEGAAKDYRDRESSS